MADSVCVDPLSGERWRDIRRLTDRPSAYAVPWFEPGPENMAALQKMRVLVVGAGGLGCELLKNLALSGFQNLDVIDMDIIDVSNLNRQFLFRMSDVGKSKAEVAAAFVQSRVSGCTVTAHNCRIEDKPPSFYRQFSLCDLVLMENGEVDTSTVIPLIDGGTEGFKGNARVIYPKLSACVDCTLDLFPPQVTYPSLAYNLILVNFPLCTIAHTPRLPEHCVEYVKVVQWIEEGAALDADDPAHVDWVLEKALERAQKYGINGVDRRLTHGVLKRIIPAVASTNAVIAASCALEAVKLATNTAKPINNYLNFTDVEGVYCGVVQMEKDVSIFCVVYILCYLCCYYPCVMYLLVRFLTGRIIFWFQPECATCSGGYVQVQCNDDDTLQILIDKLVDKFQLKNPSLETAKEKLYMINELIPELKDRSVSNLERPLRELIATGEDLLIADEVLPKSLSVRVNFVS
ncbi:unnamed protein product [Heligmosomoides polygyrus]|uniref:NEDD8-activating enzyme E1 catalytic subunit n=1 Tax=Heligmosomoides polygyrus TaxID=6339 RepID=A0A183GBJ3_HELPZ|nr:unnamed protein product [Heligmosomoides polygyrus]